MGRRRQRKPKPAVSKSTKVYEGHEAVLTTLSAQVMAVGKNKRLSKGKKGKGKKT